MLWPAGLTAQRMPPADDGVQRVQRDVLREGERERQAARLVTRPHLQLTEGEAEERAVRSVDGEPRDRPESRARDGLPEQRDVGGVAAEHAAVERLLRRPYGCGGGSADGCSASGHPRRLCTPPR